MCDEGYTGVACLTLISACDSGNCSVTYKCHCIDSVPDEAVNTLVYVVQDLKVTFCTQECCMSEVKLLVCGIGMLGMLKWRLS